MLTQKEFNTLLKSTKVPRNPNKPTLSDFSIAKFRQKFIFNSFNTRVVSKCIKINLKCNNIKGNAIKFHQLRNTRAKITITKTNKNIKRVEVYNNFKSVKIL